jgi:hypothetical protein
MMPPPGGCGLLAPGIVPGVCGALLPLALLGSKPCCWGPPLLLLLGWETPCCAAFIIFLYLLRRFWNQIFTCKTQRGAACSVMSCLSYKYVFLLVVTCSIGLATAEKRDMNGSEEKTTNLGNKGTDNIKEG